MKAYIVVIGLLIVIFGAIGGYLYQKFSALAAMDFSPPPVTIAASIAQGEIWDERLNAVGTVQSVRGVELTSETSGEITRILFGSGDAVKANQLLVVLNDEVEQASRRNQTAALELAEILFERDRTLIEQKSIPQTQYDRSRADLERAKAQLAETEARLANKQIEAPFSGTMGIARVDIGDYISPGTLIATLQDHSELEIDFTVPARYAPRLEAGLSVAVKVDAFPDQVFDAEVMAVDSKIDPSTRNILLRARLAEPGGLLPGMFASLEVDLGLRIDVVTIPETAMTYALQGNTVYVIEDTEDGGQTAVARVVQAGQVRDGKVAVLSGLEAGEQVVSVGQNKLFRGVKVLIDESVRL
ncbi:MAG: efflux RND transporter periplasmic adaptor subunit [Pseudomonadales bacterium]|nr:efflux RND transporter periplasmic adaptor subunit [Pseudomonadales bacterium]MBO6594376.1 efflux RND transporter periplasmic adaptor subunit [Pseudomonadales bacterium]MBO6655552.1 efflux RND transporter periplasmic adaptor subunit [Pseudomonadales bacterium]MBO6700877.1 efflux RND transporter periplasmic adaptor subunit [Pseudomonadales bacterium]MBO6822063.1 efflux RND transporter periplasmic adaptor subunit [Pseudomonadales bacterium]